MKMNTQQKDYVKPIFVSLSFAVLFFIFIFSAFYAIDGGEKGVLLTFGKIDPAPLDSGLGIKIPFAQKVIKMETRTRKYTAEASAASKDLQVVSATVVTNYHIVPDDAPRIYAELGQNYDERIIQPLEQEVVKSVTAKFTAEELIVNRETVRLNIKDLLFERLLSRGIVVEDLSIVDFDFSNSFNSAIEQKVTAEQLKLKADRDLQRIEVEAEQVKAAAIGQRDAAIAYAEGQAESIRLVNEELKKSPDYVAYLEVQKWDGKLPLVTGDAVPFVELPGGVVNG